MKKKNHCCRNCHFLTKNTGAYITQSWDKDDRLLCWPEGNRDKAYLAGIPAENRSAFKVYKVGCYKNEWERGSDELVGGISRQSLKEEILRNREGKCFFEEYRAGEEFSEAEERLRANRDTRHHKSTLFWQKFTAIVAVIAAFASLIAIGLQIYEKGSTP